MQTSAPGSRRPGPPPGGLAARGFTLVELLIVVALVALAAGIVSLALRDADAGRLDEEGARLIALLERARADSRVTGVPVIFVPRNDADTGQPVFRFVGLPANAQPVAQWLDPRTEVQVLGRPALVLGPDAILPPQRVLLRLGDHRLVVATDGLAPFAVAEDDETEAPR